VVDSKFTAFFEATTSGNFESKTTRDHYVARVRIESDVRKVDVPNDTNFRFGTLVPPLPAPTVDIIAVIGSRELVSFNPSYGHSVMGKKIVKFMVNMQRRIVVGAVLSTILIIGLPVTKTLAQGAGDLIVAPTRVVFDDRTRSAQLSLANKGSETATYRISLINMRMDDNGQLIEIDRPGEGELFAENLIRYSPRQVVLEPGAAQTIRLLLRKPADLAPGEYRSHMLFRAIPEDGGVSVEAPADPNALSVNLIPIFGISIPVIVRHGDLSADVSLADIQVLPPDEQNTMPRAAFTLVRDGQRSAFGDLHVTLEKAGETPVVVGQIMRLAVYTPNKSRRVTVQLRVPDDTTLSGGTLKVVFTNPGETPDKAVTTATATLQ